MVLFLNFKIRKYVSYIQNTLFKPAIEEREIRATENVFGVQQKLLMWMRVGDCLWKGRNDFVKVKAIRNVFSVPQRPFECPQVWGHSWKERNAMLPSKGETHSWVFGHLVTGYSALCLSGDSKENGGRADRDHVLA